MKINYRLFFLIIIISGCSHNNSDKTINDKLIGVNPITYTDVVYAGSKDSVYVSTFSGRIDLRLNGLTKEIPIINIGDEIYALAYSKKRKEIIAATNSNGILVIDSEMKKVKHELMISDKSWTLNVFFSEDEKELYAFDLNGKNYTWNVDNNYNVVQLPESFPKNYLRYIKGDTIYTSSSGKICTWDKEKSKLIKEGKVQGEIKSVDEKGNVLLIDDNEFKKYSISNDSVLYSKTHPSYIRILANGDTLRDAYMKLKLTDAHFIGNRILTAGADRSLRLWNSDTGEVIKDFIGHKASITAIDVAKNDDQFVSVDAKGGIRFWNFKKVDTY